MHGEGSQLSLDLAVGEVVRGFGMREDGGHAGVGGEDDPRSVDGAVREVAGRLVEQRGGGQHALGGSEQFDEWLDAVNADVMRDPEAMAQSKMLVWRPAKISS